LASYRLYRLDGAGRISSAEWLEATDDEDAARKARERSLDGTCEVWERNRLIARIEPGKDDSAV
jgi:hypothetical protein